MSSKGKHYALLKDNNGFENYLTKLHGATLLSMIKFRTCNHKFPVERGRWDNIEFANRTCELCPKNDIGDNFHYLLICPFFESQRKQYIDFYYFTRPNVIKYKKLLNITSEPKLRKLSIFMKHFMTHFQKKK